MKMWRTVFSVSAAVVTMSLIGTGAYSYTALGDDREPQQRTPDQFAMESQRPVAEHDCGKSGAKQREVEENLDSLGEYGKVFVDGEQSQQDCDAIVDFQKRMGIRPAEGKANKLTADVASRLSETDTESSDCEDGKGLVVCVDLTHQTLWVVDGDEVVFEPTVVRTGMKGGYQTTVGKHHITNKAKREWSIPFEEWLPSWQHFYNGEGLHETTSYIHNPDIGSHGCVNLLHDDAKKLYRLLDVGDTIDIFGNRPGT